VAIGDNHPGLRVDYNWTTEVQGWKAGETYELSGWIKVEKAKQPAFIMVQFWDKNEDKKLRRMIGGAGDAQVDATEVPSIITQTSAGVADRSRLSTLHCGRPCSAENSLPILESPTLA